MKKDIYNYQGKIEAYEKKLERDDLLEEQKQSIREFKQFLVLRNYSIPRIVKYYEILIKVSKIVKKPFMDWNKNDIFTIVDVLQKKGSAEWTKVTHYSCIKRFFKWLYKSGRNDCPELVRDLNTNLSKCNRPLPSEGELLTEDEAIKLLEATRNPRDKAFVSILWETGARISEIANLLIREATFDKHGGFISVLGKTGSRKIRIVSSIPHLSNWLAHHPNAHDRDSPIWVGYYNGKTRGRKLTYGFYWQFLKALFKRAGINKKCNPHLFRHSRATYLANHLTEFQMNQYLGWVQGSDMPSTYVHLSGRNTNDALLKLHGIEPEIKQEESKLKPKVCVRCGHINAFDFAFCGHCACALDEEAVRKLETEEENTAERLSGNHALINNLFSDPECLEFIYNKLKTLKVSDVKASL